jgi:hypothetical protein
LPLVLLLNLVMVRRVAATGALWWASGLQHLCGQLQLDFVMVKTWFLKHEADPYLAAYDEVQIEGYTFYFRKDSPRVLWDRVAALRR